MRAIVREILGLFVDDGSFAFLILAWLGLTVFLVPHLGWVPRWRGLILFSGLAAILMSSAVHFARKKT
jgi:hypothetical protein